MNINDLVVHCIVSKITNVATIKFATVCKTGCECYFPILENIPSLSNLREANMIISRKSSSKLLVGPLKKGLKHIWALADWCPFLAMLVFKLLSL